MRVSATGVLLWLALLACITPDLLVGSPQPRSPFVFEPNRGQDAGDAAYIANASGVRVGLRPGSVSFRFSQDPQPLRLVFVNAQQNGSFQPQDRLASESNYLAAPVINHLPNFGRVTYRNLYPGIDATFYGRGDQMEYDLVLKAGALPNQIRWQVKANRIAIERDGTLRIEKDGHRLSLLQPQAYQVDSDGIRRAIDARYRVVRRGHDAVIRFKLGPYDHSRELVIDPVLVWGEYLQTQYLVRGSSTMTTDTQGNIYALTGGSVVQKFDTWGKLVYTATLANVPGDPAGIAVDSAGRAYIVGSAGPGLPTTPNAFQSTNPGSPAAYLAVFSADGASLVYCTYLGGSMATYASAIAVRSDGIPFVTGSTDSPDFPVSANAYRKQLGPGVQDGCCDVDDYYGFVTKFDISQSGPQSMVYSTLIGPAPPIGIGVDAAGRAYVLQGVSLQQSVPTPGAFQFPGYFYSYFIGDGAYGSLYNSSFVTAFNLDGSALVYSAELGGINPAKIAVDAGGAAYVAATYVGKSFPITPGAYLATYPQGIALKLTPDGSALAYSTYLGAPMLDPQDSLSVDGIALLPGCVSNCEAFISGSLFSYSQTPPNFPLIAPIQGQDLPGKGTGFLVRLAANGSSASFSSYFGSENYYNGNTRLGVDQFANIYVLGAGGNLPATQSPNGATNPDVYLAKISPSDDASGLANPNSLSFGHVPVGVASESYFSVNSGLASTISRTIQLTNFGSKPLTIDSIVPSGNELSVLNGCQEGGLAAGETCAMTIQFLPAAPGLRSGTIQINGNGNRPRIELYFKGYGTSGPYLEFSPRQLTFADAVVGSQTAPQAITIRNAGDQSLAKVVLTTGNLDFPIQTNCPQPLPARATCQANVTFAPVRLGTYFSTLQRGASTPGHGGQVTLTGTGIAAGAGGAGMLSVSAATLNFDPTSTGDVSYQKFSFTNTSAVPVTLDGIVISSGDFSVAANSCAQSANSAGQFMVPVQGVCYLVVQFTPLALGTKSAALTFASSVGTAPALLLNGTARAPNTTIGFQPATVTFAATSVGTSSDQQVNIANLGQERIIIDRLYATGDFAVAQITSSCCTTPLPQTSAAGVVPQYYPAAVSFQPTATGTRSGQLVVVTVTGATATLPLTGMGVPAGPVPPGILAISPDSLDFAPGPVGGASAPQSVQLSNEGTAPLTVTGVTTTGAFQAASVCTLPAVLTTSSCAVNVVFTPTTTGVQTGELVVNTSGGPQVMPLSGSGITAVDNVQILPTAGDFGNVQVGASLPGGVEILNLGTSPLSFPPAPFAISGDGFSLDTNAFPVGFSIPVNGVWLETLTFKPLKAGSYAGSFTFTNTKGEKETMPLKGTGVTDAAAAWTQAWLPFFAGYPFVLPAFQNNGNTPIQLTKAAITQNQAAFKATSTCSGSTLAPAASCYASLSSETSTSGFQLGNFAVYDSNNNSYNLPLFAYSPPTTNSSALGDNKLEFPAYSPPAVVGGPPVSRGTFLVNTGSSNLNIGPIVVSGPFTISPGTDQCSGQAIPAQPPSQNCTVSFLFTPVQAGVFVGGAQFPVTYADGSKITQSLTLVGHAEAVRVGPAVISGPISYPALAAGNVFRSDAAVTNTGNVDLKLGVPTLVNVTQDYNGTADFYLLNANPCGALLSGNGSCDLELKFRPYHTGNLTGSITIPVYYPGNANPKLLTVMLQGTGITAQPALSVSPGALEFGYESVGVAKGAAVERNVMVRNTGNVNASFSSDTATAPFAIVSDLCAGSQVAPAQSCAIVLAFVPTMAEDSTGSLTLQSSASQTPMTVALAGTGLSGAQQLSLSQTSLDFGSQLDGTAGIVQTLYISNRGSMAAQGLQVSLTGPDATEFVLVSTSPGCGTASFAGHQTCAVGLRFKPGATSTGMRSAALDISGVPIGGATSVPLQGLALTPSP